MLKIKLTDRLCFENKVEGYVVFLSENFEAVSPEGLDSCISDIEKDFYPHVKLILKKHKFKGKVGQSFALSALKGKSLAQFIFVGVGKLDIESHKELENLRRSIGAAVLKLKALEVTSAVLQVPDNTPFGIDQQELVTQMAVAAYMADYEFTTFKSEKNGAKWECELLFSADCGNCEPCQQALEKAEIIGKSVNQTRLLCDMPPNIATPTYVSEEAKRIANDHMGLKCAVFGKEKAEELEMGGFLSVDVGSEQPGKFVVLEYDCEEDESAPTIVLVGKGVTFDSGGISLKPANYMTGMKFDMSGAAAVIGAMQAIAQLKPNVHVVGLAPLVENMPSGRANKQDDIVTFMNGKTAEIINTDAEGRLILADALCYAEKFYKPDVIVDIATLTGACLYALGHSYSALMTNDKKLSSLLRDSGLISGDLVWELPLDEDFKPAIKSEVADIANAGAPAYKAGTITAGWFLSNFVEKASWAHIDIAGTADRVPGVNYLGKGATGAGVRLLVDFVLKYKK